MKNKLPTKSEWNDAGFTVPNELCDTADQSAVLDTDAHTPTPWIVTENGANGYVTIEGAGRAVVHQSDLGSIPDEACGKERLSAELVGNALHIARCVNGYNALKASHDRLLEALHDMVEPFGEDSNWQVNKAKSAIVQAEALETK